MTSDLQDYAEESFCYLTTTGRVTGRPHTIEIWFALDKHTLYMLSGGRDKADWVKNALRQPNVTIKIKDTLFSGHARLVQNPDEDALARRIVLDKYVNSGEENLEEWSRTSLPVAVDLLDESQIVE